MKTAKQLLAVVMVMAMLAALLTSCSGTSGSAPGTGAGQSTASAPGTGGDTAEPLSTYTFKMGSTHTDPYNPASLKYIANTLGVRHFIAAMDELTNGRVKFETYFNSTLGSQPEMYQMVMMGELDFFYGQPMSSFDQRYAAWNLPYMFDNHAEIISAVNPENGPVFKLAEKWLAEKGVKLLGISMSFLRGFINSAHEVRVPSDCRDLKIRSYEDQLVTTFWSGLGTTSVISMGEMFSALQTNTVDAMEIHPTACYALHLYEVTDYYTDINWQWTNGGSLCMPMSLWESLPADIQDALKEAARRLFEAQAAQEQYDTQTVLDALHTEGGMTITKITDEERAQWRAYARTLDDKFREYIGPEVFDEYMAAVQQAKDMVKNGTAYTVEPQDLMHTVQFGS